MNKYISLYVSTIDKDGKTVNPKKHAVVLSKVEFAFLNIFEGFTETEGVGMWKAPDGTVTKEKITIVKAFYDMQSSARVRTHVRRVIEDVKALLNQDYVSLEQNGDLELV